MKGLIIATTEVLGQVLTTLDVAKGTAYTDIPEGMTSCMGRHIRHVLDHYTALQTGIVSGEVDYDQRSRDSEIESSTEVAKQQVLNLIKWVNADITNDMPLNMKTEISISSQQFITVDSSLKRELIYLLNHTVHHMAQVSFALRILNINIDSEIGIAPATLTYLLNDQMREVG